MSYDTYKCNDQQGDLGLPLLCYLLDDGLCNVVDPTRRARTSMLEEQDRDLARDFP